MRRRELFVGDGDFVSTAGAAACLAYEFAPAEAFIAFVLHDAAAVAKIALHHSLLRGQFARAFAFIAFGWD